MTYQPQKFIAPDGTEMVVLKATDYQRLLARADDDAEFAEANAIAAAIDDGAFTVPDAVIRAIIVDRLSPLKAWRLHRGQTQAELAKSAGLSQVWIGRIETGGGYGSPATRRKLAKALAIPLWALEELE
jgi:DNA-binding XRE family transcriptional regulator